MFVELNDWQLAGHNIVSWKPQPAHLVGTFDEKMIREYYHGRLRKHPG